MKLKSRKEVAKDFEKIPNEDKQRIVTELKKLRAAQTLSESHLKKIKGVDNQFRLRVGTYRIIMESFSCSAMSVSISFIDLSQG
jgi:mRNA-degrading endonuclease RelE of RelBE toxin-antitoxin system